MKCNRFLLLVRLFLILAIQSCGTSLAQEPSPLSNESYTFNINKITLENGKLKCHIYGLDANGDPLKLEDLKATAVEKINGASGPSLDPSGSGTEENTQERNGNEIVSKDDTVKTVILILLDASSSMKNENGDKFIKAKDAVREILKNNLYPESTFFSWFADDCSPNRLINSGNANQILPSDDAPYDGVLAHERNSDSYYFLNWKVDSLDKDPKYKGYRKVLYFLTDGEDANNKVKRYPPYGNRQKIEKSDLMNRLSALPSDFEIYTIGIYEANDPRGNPRYLQEVVNSTPSPNDKYSISTPDQLASVVKKSFAKYGQNMYLLFESANQPFQGESREISISVTVNGTKELYATKTYSFGTSAAAAGSSNLPLVIGIGLGIVLLLLLFFVVLVPQLSIRAFQKKYVLKFKDYKRKRGLGKEFAMTDIYDQVPLLPNDWVVDKCKACVKFSTWQVKDECPNNKPGGCPNGCEDGAGDSEYRYQKKFFNQQSAQVKRLNWLWFGLAGGYLSWLVFTLLTLAKPLAGLFSGFFPEAVAGAGAAHTGLAEQMEFQFYAGLGLSFCLSLFFSWVDEKGGSRDFSPGRILLRVALTTLLVPMVFVLVEKVRIDTLPEYLALGKFFAWFVFGTLLSLILSIQSTVPMLRAILAGAIASFLGALMGLVLPLVTSDAQAGNLLAYMSYGAILGTVTSIVVDSLEDFWLDVKSPSEFAGRNFPISKWLLGRSSAKVYIGSGQVCEVKVKWPDDQVKAKHVQLSLEDGHVMLKPLGRTFVNGVDLKDVARLKVGDRIQVGGSGISVFQFGGKLKGEEKTGPPRKSRPAPPQQQRQEQNWADDDIVIISSTSSAPPPDPTAPPWPPRNEPVKDDDIIILD